MKKKSMIITLTLILAVSIFGVSGCGKKQEESTSTEESAENTENTEVKKIKLATTPGYKPFVYQDENDELVGYEVELAKAVFDKLPQYELEFEYTEWQSVLTGLDSGIYQISAESIFYTDERAEKYFYSDPIFYDPIVAVTAEDGKDITSFDDLQGETIHVQAGDLWSFAAEKYNEEHPGKEILLDYGEVDRFQMYANIEAGKYSILTDIGAYLGTTADNDFKVKKTDLNKEDLDKYFETTYTYFLLSKGGGEESEQLLKDVNAALKEVMEDGTAKALSEKYFDGQDLTPSGNE